jgi:UDP-3-O-[3-hydroxymyristoyl] N-acetylglucosamine deacetylase
MTAAAFKSSVDCRKQRTLKRDVCFSGIGVHTGEIVNIRFCPAKEGNGVVFQRIDLQERPVVPATVEYVCDTLRCTTLGVGNVRIHTVEHIMAALAAYQIDNLVIEIDGVEPPVGNGSSDVFIQMIEDAGIEEQTSLVPVVKIHKPIYWSEGEIHLVALPYDGYRISYTLNYPDIPALRCQYQSFLINCETFKTEIAPCRTFSLYKEISHLMDRGLIKGASLDNGIAIDNDVVFSKGGLYFPDEMVRHKILDMIGDFALLGFDFEAHIIAIRSGHASNYAFAKKLYNSITRESKDE